MLLALTLAATLSTLPGSLQDKNFPLLSFLERDPAVTAALAADPALREIFTAKRNAVHVAAETCEMKVPCLIAPARLSDAEIETAAQVLRRLYREDAGVRKVVDDAVRSSDVYVRFENEDLLARAWRDVARGVNNIVEVYGSGKPPRSANIDAVSFDVNGTAYARTVQAVADVLDEDLHDASLFFQPSARFAVRLLEANHRDEASRHEPLQTGANAAVLARIPSIRWSEFPYTAILVPGSGPDRLTWSLSPQARLRCELAARRFRQRKAPLLIVSGGNVHPNQTPFNEAVEMKKALVETFGVPADAILIEPHARHTTTNLRNAARLVFRYGIPTERKMLVTTDRGHSEYIGGKAFAERCDLELGYQPATVVGRVSPFDVEVVPRGESLQVDPGDPLDP
jgi:hypothetical protein